MTPRASSLSIAPPIPSLPEASYANSRSSGEPEGGKWQRGKAATPSFGSCSARTHQRRSLLAPPPIRTCDAPVLLARRKAVNIDVKYVRPAGRYWAAWTSLHVSERNSLARIFLRGSASAAASPYDAAFSGSRESSR